MIIIENHEDSFISSYSMSIRVKIFCMYLNWVHLYSNKRRLLCLYFSEIFTITEKIILQSVIQIKSCRSVLPEFRLQIIDPYFRFNPLI